MVWLRLGATLIVFVVSCLGLAYLSELWARRKKWPPWTGILMSVAIALIWPAVVIIDTGHETKQHRTQYPNEVDDASGFIILGAYFFWVPVLFFLSLVLARVGVFFVRRNRTSRVA
jgi:hypothetical protein